MIDHRHLRLILGQQDHVTRARLNRVWRDVEARMHRDIQELADKILARKAAGDPVPISWLYEHGRLRGLADQVHQQVSVAVPKTARIVDEATDAAAAFATLESERMVRDARGAIRLRTERVREAVRLIDHHQTGEVLSQLPQAVAERVESAFLHAVAVGSPASVFARELAKVEGYPRYRAQMIARTEMHRVFRETSRTEWLAAKDVVAGWTWVASLDKRCCPVCVAMHGTEHPLEEQMATHPACRCVMAPIPRDVKARDPLTPGADQFNQWPEDRQLEVVGPTRLRLIKGGDIQLQDLVERRDHPIWGPSSL